VRVCVSVYLCIRMSLSPSASTQQLAERRERGEFNVPPCLQTRSGICRDLQLVSIDRLGRGHSSILQLAETG
jgi:hypothetical protein